MLRHEPCTDGIHRVVGGVPTKRYRLDVHSTAEHIIHIGTKQDDMKSYVLWCIEERYTYLDDLPNREMMYTMEDGTWVLLEDVVRRRKSISTVPQRLPQLTATYRMDTYKKIWNHSRGGMYNWDEYIHGPLAASHSIAAMSTSPRRRSPRQGMESGGEEEEVRKAVEDARVGDCVLPM